MRVSQDSRGSAYVEFIIVIIPFIIFILALIQMALMFAGQAIVQRAANTAARAAIVVLDDDPQYYGDEARNQVSYSGGSSGHDPVAAMVNWMGGAHSSLTGSGSARLAAIRAAASMPLLALSPPMADLVGSDDIYHAIGAAKEAGNLAGAAVYNKAAVAVTFPTGPGASTDRTSFGMRDHVTVRVTYLYYCGVPLVRYLMCESIVSMQSGSSIDAARDLANARPEDVQFAGDQLRARNARLGRWRPGLAEMDKAEMPWLSSLSALTGARFVVMRAEATLPNQGAPYRYGSN